MWPGMMLLLREFARRPTIDHPELVDPGLGPWGLGLAPMPPMTSMSPLSPPVVDRWAKPSRPRPRLQPADLRLVR